MSQSTFSVRMDENLKEEFDTLCTDFGMSMSTAINVFARAVVRERKIPFEIAESPEAVSARARKSIEAIRTRAQEKGISDMSLDEINAEIKAARAERKKA